MPHDWREETKQRWSCKLCKTLHVWTKDGSPFYYQLGKIVGKKNEPEPDCDEMLIFRVMHS
jgi:hypothetical protein